TAPTIGYTVSVEIFDAASCNGTPGTTVLDQSIAPGQAPQLQNIVLFVECVPTETVEPSPTPTPTTTP
ncbi:MAG: Stk1 family Ser/Thr kinase, partial [Actinomycetota bacterium]